MTRCAPAMFAAAFMLAAGPAAAHTIIEGVRGFPGGALHAILVPANLLALLAVGLLAGEAGGAIRVAASVGAGCLSACVLIVLAYSTARAEWALLGLAAMAGLLLAGAIRVPSPLLAMLGAIAGAAVTFESVPATISVPETLLSLAGTALAAIALVAALAFALAVAPDGARRIGLRIAGAWIAASAAMVLALRLAV